MTKDYNEEYVFNIGVVWEDNPWKIITNYKDSGVVPCKHCFDLHDEIHTYGSGLKYTKEHWICPRIIVVQNEGGYNSTGLCLDCLLEAVQTIK